MKGQHPLRAEIISHPKRINWVGQYAPLDLCCLWTKVHQVFSLNVEGVVVERVFLRFSMCRSFPEIFATKVESCQEAWRFWPSKYLGGGPSKSCTNSVTSASQHVVCRKFRKDISTGPKVIGAQTLNFMPNFKFSPLVFRGEPLFPMGVH